MTDNTGKTVLMVDDERFLLDMYKVAFERAGFTVQTYRDVDAALEALRGGISPDAILFDLTMPDSRSGYEFIESLKREGLAPHARTVALTNAGQDGALSRLTELGTDAHILKSNYVPSQIVQAVERLLDENS